MRRVRVEMSGLVQGVFLRATCAERARALELGGWVRNTAEGNVEAAFEGPHEAVEAILAWCREGPPGARVESVQVREETPIGEAVFRVTR